MPFPGQQQSYVKRQVLRCKEMVGPWSGKIHASLSQISVRDAKTKIRTIV
jgi:hypothetical protein